MKFLEDMFDGMDLMPLNIYYNKGTFESKNDDYIDIIFKDMITGKQYVKTIDNPDIEIWITKPEFRNYNYIKNFIDKDKCNCVKMKYKTRFLTIAKLLKCPVEEAKYSPYIFQADMKLEHFYLMQFIMEYHNEKMKKVSIGYLDIENDIFQVNRFPEPGEAPINAVTFIDGDRRQVYTLVLKKDNIPFTNEDNPKHKVYEDMRTKFWEMFEEFEKHIPEFIDNLKHGDEEEAGYDEIYGEFNYNILIIEKEIDFITLLFKIIRASANDYVYIWNSPYDMQNIIERIKYLGADPFLVMGDPAFKGKQREVKFIEDTNAMAHKRKHVCETFTMQTFIDQMVVYAGIRSARGKIPSLKLNAIAKKELKDTKLDYSEEGDMKYFPYTNFKKFVKYNIKDVLLQYGINTKVKDSTTMYMNMYSSAVLPNEIFTSTTILANSIRMFVFDLRKGYLMGSNKNKLFKNGGFDYKKILADLANEDLTEDQQQSTDDDYDLPNDESDDEEEEEDNDKKKKDKFQGAFVMNPPHMSPTGFKLFGKPSQYIHENAIDMDITSEYPSAIIIMNASNDTLVGRVFIDDPSSVSIPMFENFNFIGDERAEYKFDVSNFMLEVYSQHDVLNFGTYFLDLPTFSDILDDSKSVIDSLRK